MYCTSLRGPVFLFGRCGSADLVSVAQVLEIRNGTEVRRTVPGLPPQVLHILDPGPSGPPHLWAYVKGILTH